MQEKYVLLRDKDKKLYVGQIEPTMKKVRNKYNTYDIDLYQGMAHKINGNKMMAIDVAIEGNTVNWWKLYEETEKRETGWTINETLFKVLRPK